MTEAWVKKIPKLIALKNMANKAIKKSAKGVMPSEMKCSLGSVQK